MKQIQITINGEGDAIFEPTGFKGKACEVAAELEKALGLTVSSKKKPEYFASAESVQQIGGAK